MATETGGVQQLRDLSLRLRAAGDKGKGLRRELSRAINDAAQPFMETIADPEWLKPYMPDGYAEVLAADLAVRAQTRTGAAPGVTIRVKGRVHKERQVRLLEQGFLRHPVYADRGTPRRGWRWRTQTGGMRPGFFSDATRAAGPQIRDEVLKAMHDVAQKIAGK